MTMFTDNSLQARYRIIESDIGPLISESRCTVFDVMMLYDAGEALYGISTILNLTPLQVEIALDYIAQHRATLEPQVAEILRQRAERETYYRAIANEIFDRAAYASMTETRAKFNALREHNARDYAVTTDAQRPE